MTDMSTNLLQLRGDFGDGVLTGVRRNRTALYWGGLGFVIGALFWHFIGFWSFVSQIVLNGDGTPVPAQAVVRKNDVHAASKKAAAEAARFCVKLIRSKTPAPAAAGPCDPDDRILRQAAGVAPRQDRAPLHPSAGWAATAQSPAGATASN